MLDVAGRTFTLDELRALGEETRHLVLHCTTGPRPEADFTGVSLGLVLAHVDADALTAHSGDDDYTVTVGLDEARRGFLAWAKDGEPTPLRFIADSGSVKSVTHLTPA